MNSEDKKKYYTDIVINKNYTEINNELLKYTETLGKIYNNELDTLSSFLFNRNKEIVKTKTFRVKVDRFLDFKDTNKCKIQYKKNGQFDKMNYANTQEYIDYQEMIINKIDSFKDDIIDFMPLKRENDFKIKLNIFFKIKDDSKGRNICKQFVDTLFRSIGDRKKYDDSQLFSYEFRYLKTDNDFEEAIFTFEKINDLVLAKQDHFLTENRNIKDFNKRSEFIVSRFADYLLSNTDNNYIEDEIISKINNSVISINSIKKTYSDIERQENSSSGINEKNLMKISLDKIPTFDQCKKNKITNDENVVYNESNVGYEYSVIIDQFVLNNKQKIKEYFNDNSLSYTKLNIVFYVDYIQKDIDNLTTPFNSYLKKSMMKHLQLDLNSLKSTKVFKFKTSCTVLVDDLIYVYFEKTT